MPDFYILPNANFTVNWKYWSRFNLLTKEGIEEELQRILKENDFEGIPEVKGFWIITPDAYNKVVGFLAQCYFDKTKRFQYYMVGDALSSVEVNAIKMFNGSYFEATSAKPNSFKSVFHTKSQYIPVIGDLIRNYQSGGYINLVLKCERLSDNTLKIYSVRYAKNTRNTTEYLEGKRVRPFIWNASTWSVVEEKLVVLVPRIVYLRKTIPFRNFKQIKHRMELPWEVYTPPDTEAVAT